MSLSYDHPDYPAAPADTLTDSVLILLALTVVQRLIGFVRAVLFCRWLDAEQLGVWDMAFSFLVLAAPLAVLAIPGSFGRYIARYRQRGQFGSFLRWAIVSCAAIAVTSCLGIVLARRWVALAVFGTEEQSEMVAIAAACLLTVVAFNFLVELLTALRNIRLVSLMQLVNSAAFAVLGAVLLFSWQCSAQSVVLAYGGSCLIAAVWAGYRLPRGWHAAPASLPALPKFATWKEVAPFAAWVLVGNVLTNLFGVVDRYMIVHFSEASTAATLDMVGNYHSSRVVPLLLVSIATMLATMVMPHLSHDWEAGRRELAAARLRLFLKLFGFLLYAAAVAALVAAPLLFDVAFRGKFPGGEAVLPWALIYCTWFGMSLVAQNYLLCAEKARLASVALAGGLVLNVALNAVLLPRIGLEGAVLSTTAANALSLALVCLFNRRLGFHLDFGAAVMLVLPVCLCLGTWPAACSLLVVIVDAVWGHRLLNVHEKRQLSVGIARYTRRFAKKREQNDLPVAERQVTG